MVAEMLTNKIKQRHTHLSVRLHRILLHETILSFASKHLQYCLKCRSCLDDGAQGVKVSNGKLPSKQVKPNLNSVVMSSSRQQDRSCPMPLQKPDYHPHNGFSKLWSFFHIPTSPQHIPGHKISFVG